MENPLIFQKVQYFSKLRRLDSFNGGISEDRNVIELDVLKKEEKGKKNKNEQKKEEEAVKEKGIHEIKSQEKEKNVRKNNVLNIEEEQSETSFDSDEETSISFNLIKKVTIYGINLNIDLFILHNMNIIFFAQNLINIYNPIIKKLKTIYTKEQYLITSTALTGKTLIVVLYGLSKKSCKKIKL